MQDISKRELIVFTASAIVLLALGIDIMLPAFGDVRTHFGLAADSIATTNIVAFFFMGQITQIYFGYLTDKLGRIPIIRAGIIIYIVCGILVVCAPAVEWMFVFRFFAGVGAAAVVMTSVASVRDRYAGNDMANIMSFVFSLFLIIPVIAPALGTYILKVSSWQTVFLVPPCFAIIVLIWTFRIPESHPKERRLKTGIGAIFKEVKPILANKVFLKFTIIATLLFSLLSSWVSSSERIIGEIYGQPDLFPVIFGLTGLLMAGFAFINSYLTKKIGAKNALNKYLVSYFAVSLIFTVITLYYIGQPPLLIFFAFIASLMALTTAGDPNSSALALELLGERAGLGAAVYGTIFFFVGSSLGSIISGLMVSMVSPIAFSALIMSMIALVLFYSNKINIQ